MENKIHRIVSEIFGIPIEKVNDSTGVDNTPAWDSLGHLNLILALEDAFGIDILPSDVSEMMTVGKIKICVTQSI